MNKYDKVLMKTAENFAELSYCKRNKVGCVIAKDNRVVSCGYNGALSKELTDNKELTSHECEDITNEVCDKCGGKGEIDGVMCKNCTGTGLKAITKNHIAHAEFNAIMFMLREGKSTVNCDLFVTLQPCIHCAELILHSGIKRVVYKTPYRNTDGLDLLKKANIKIEKLEE